MKAGDLDDSLYFISKVLADSRFSSFSSIDKEDLYQEGYFGLMEASSKWDESKSTGSFECYAKAYIYQRILDYLRGSKYLAGCSRKRINYQIVDIKAAATIGINGTEGRYCRLDLLKRLKAGLTEKEKNVVDLYFTDEMTLDEIGSRYGVTESMISLIKKSALNKMRRRNKNLHRSKDHQGITQVDVSS